MQVCDVAIGMNCYVFFVLMIRRPPRSTRMTHSVPTRRSSDLIFELPFEQLTSRANFERKILTREGINVPFFELQWQQYRIWGATAGMLWDLAGRMENA